MIFRKVSLLLAVACASTYAFVPSRTVVTPRTMAVQSQSASFAAQISTSAPSRSSARFMSDAAAAPEPEKKSLLEKVRTHMIELYEKLFPMASFLTFSY